MLQRAFDLSAASAADAGVDLGRDLGDPVAMGRRRSFWPRRRRSNSGDAALGLLVLGAILIAALGIYFVIVGVIALFGWLAAVAARSASKSGSRIVQVEAPSTAEIAPVPPHRTFHAVIPIERETFDDRDRVEGTARSVFTSWARQLPSAPRDPSAAIGTVTLRTRLIGRLTTRLDGRRFVWRSAAHRGRDRVAGSPSVRPSDLDPYDPPRDLRVRSRYLSLCRTCDGNGKNTCVHCGGAARVACDACNGAGKVMGLTKNNARRLLNCKACKGKATTTCGDCTKGHVDCAACECSGRLEHWLDLEGGPRDGDVQVEPDGQLTQAFRWGTDGVPATDLEVQQDARPICRVTRERLLTLDDLPVEVPAHWRQAHWSSIQARLQPGERVVEQTFTLLEVPSIEIEYGLGDDRQAISLEGLRMLAPPISTDHVFASRATALHRLLVGLALVPLAVLLTYAIRGPYFLSTPAVYGVVLSAAVACAIIYVVFQQSTLGRAAKKWLAGAILPVGVATVLALMVEPSRARARTLIDEGQLDRARVELEALGAKDDPDVAQLWGDLYLKEVLAQTDCGAAQKYLREIPVPAAAQRSAARKHADELALADAAGAIGKDQLDAAEQRLQCATDDARSSKAGKKLRSRIALGRARRCVASQDWACVFPGADTVASLDDGAAADALRTEAQRAIKSEVDTTIASLKSEQDVSTRVQKQRSAIELWERYLAKAVTGLDPAALVALKTQRARDEQTLARAEQVAREKRVAEEKRQAEIAARAEKQRLADEERERVRREAAERAAKETPAPTRSCCKVCRKGCPCGDTCISCSKTCRVGPGCAC